MLGLIAADQAAKALVRAAIPLHESLTVIPNCFDLTHVRNTGAAFGILNAVSFPGKAGVIAALSTAALMALAFYAARLAPHERAARLGLACILGGAVGNLIDRLLYGYVLDFVDLYWGDVHFWAFNVADASITIGVCVMLLDLLGIRRNVPETV
jgi:signal peptidase II